MKKLIILIALLFLSACIATQYTVVQIPNNLVVGGIEVKLPKDSPDITKFDKKWQEKFGYTTCALFYKNTKTGAIFTLVVDCSGTEILGVVDCNCEEGNKEDTKYYIYRERGGVPELVTRQEFKKFLAEYDPAFKEQDGSGQTKGRKQV